MRLDRLAAYALVAAALLAPAAAAAQQRNEMIFYSNPNYVGSRYALIGPQANITAGWDVRSIRMAPADRWQVCTQTQYRGDCTTLSNSVSQILTRVRSARPVGNVSTLPTPIPPIVGDADGSSLRGMSAEFFPAPARQGQRVKSCKTGKAACAAERADLFCQSRGWTTSSYERQETLRGRLYLADVLCTRAGN